MTENTSASARTTSFSWTIRQPIWIITTLPFISFSENEENRKHLFDGIRKIVREEISAVFENVDNVQESISEKSVISAKAPESENAKNDNSENISDNDYDENEEYVDDDFLNM